MAARMAAVHAAGLPGRNVQAATSRATFAGATRLRRRLSKILNREIRDKRLRMRPERLGTHGKSQRRICQSPRTQRCSRREWARTLAG